MARARDLAGLAALAGLAYMANRKDKEKERGMDARGKAEMARMAALGEEAAYPINALNDREAGDPVDQTEAMADMGPRGSRAKVNPETNALYYPEGAPAPARSAAKAPARPAAKAPTKTPPAASARASAAYNPNVPTMPAGGTDTKTYSRSMGAGAGEAAAYERQRKENFNTNANVSSPAAAQSLAPQAQAPARAAPQAPAARPSAAGQKYSADPDATIGKFVPGIGYVDVNGNIMSRNRQYKKGGAVKTKKMANGGVTSASKRADGIASRGKTKCKMY